MQGTVAGITTVLYQQPFFIREQGKDSDKYSLFFIAESCLGNFYLKFASKGVVASGLIGKG